MRIKSIIVLAGIIGTTSVQADVLCEGVCSLWEIHREFTVEATDVPTYEDGHAQCSRIGGTFEQRAGSAFTWDCIRYSTTEQYLSVEDVTATAGNIELTQECRAIGKASSAIRAEAKLKDVVCKKIN